MPGAFVAVDPTLETPPYAQIGEQIRGSIERGDVAPGAVLPTVRQLAGDLGVAPNTVARAYAELQAAGWIQSDGRRGTRVARRVPSNDRRARAHLLRDAVTAFIHALAHRGYSTAEIVDELQHAARAS